MSNIFDDSAFDNFGIKDAPSKNGNTSYQKIKYLGGSKQQWPLRIRLLLNPHHPAERKHFHDTITHSKNFNGRWIMTNCPRTVNKPCPMCEKYYSLVTEAKEAKAKGAPEATLKAINKEADSYKPKKGISVLAVEAGGSEIKLYNMGVKLAEQLFGKNEIRGTLEDFKEMGVKWYSPTETMGWIEIQRSGEKLETVYRAEPWQAINKATRTKSYVEEALSPEVIENMNDPVNMYRIHENFVKNIWSFEELTGYVNSGLSVLPDRIAKMYKIDQSFKAKPIGDEVLAPPSVQQRPVSQQAAPVRTAPAAPEKPKSAFDIDDIPF